VELWVDRLEVAHVNRPPEDLLVKGTVEVGVEKSVAAMVVRYKKIWAWVDSLDNSFADDASNEFEVRQVVDVAGVSFSLD
jgi:hypothetical protein